VGAPLPGGRGLVVVLGGAAGGRAPAPDDGRGGRRPTAGLRGAGGELRRGVAEGVYGRALWVQAVPGEDASTS